MDCSVKNPFLKWIISYTIHFKRLFTKQSIEKKWMEMDFYSQRVEVEPSR